MTYVLQPKNRISAFLRQIKTGAWGKGGEHRIWLLKLYIWVAFEIENDTYKFAPHPQTGNHLKRAVR